MHAPSARTRKIAAFSAGPLAVLIAGGMVWQGSQAAFTATTSNDGNSWSSGQVALTDDDQGVAAFNVENVVPGQTGQKCITVTSGANVPGVLKTYFRDLAPSAQGLEDHITLQLETGTSGGSFASCADFVADEPPAAAQPIDFLAGQHSDFATGLLERPTDGESGETRTYRFTWAFNTGTITQAEVDALQGARTSLDIVWELQTDDTPTQP
jgi:hypothetical protein